MSRRIHPHAPAGTRAAPPLAAVATGARVAWLLISLATASASDSASPAPGAPPSEIDSGGDRIPDAWERMREVENGKAKALFEKAEQARLEGRAGTALDRYEAVVRRFRRTEWAARAQFAVGELYDGNREFRSAFDAYQAFIDHFRASDLFERAIDGQMRAVTRCLAARRAAERAGRRPSKTEIPSPEIVLRMLEMLVSNARFSSHAADAQFLLAGGLEQAGRLEEARDAHDVLVDRYPEHRLADDAAFQAAYIDLKLGTRDRLDPGRWEAARLRFELLVARFPASDKAPQARRRLAQIRALDVRHHIDLADYYENRGNSRAASIYWTELVRRYPDLRTDERVAEAFARLGLSDANSPSDDHAPIGIDDSPADTSAGGDVPPSEEGGDGTPPSSP